MSRILNALRQSTDETALESMFPVGTIFPEAPAPTPAPSIKKVFTAVSEPPTNRLGQVLDVQVSVSPQNRVEALTHPNEFAAEQFRVLGLRLQCLAEARGVKTLLVTSASFREGKSFVCANLGITLAQRSAKKVLLVEADLRKPALCEMLGLPKRRGLSDWAQGNEPLANFVVRLANLNVWLLPAGTPCDQPLTVIQSPRLRELSAETAQHFDWTIIDSSPLLVADASVLSRACDGTLVVVRQETTRLKALQKSLTSLERVLGFVFNGATDIDPRDYDQYYTPPLSSTSAQTPYEVPDAAAESNDIDAVAR